MLVLTRKKGERVLIGDDIVVTLIDIRGDGVRIGFDAPRGVPIQRAEVVTAVTEANTEAAATSASAGEVLVGLLSRGARPGTDAEAAVVGLAAAAEAVSPVVGPAAAADSEAVEPRPAEAKSSPSSTPLPEPALPGRAGEQVPSDAAGVSAGRGASKPIPKPGPRTPRP